MTYDEHPLPFPLTDGDGYPTQSLLVFIELYNPTEAKPISWFVQLIIAAWWPGDGYGTRAKRPYRQRQRLHLSTGGWSGNEEIISAIHANTMLCAAHFTPLAWRRGGHYQYEIRLA